MTTCELCRFFEEPYCHADVTPLERGTRDPICRRFEWWEKNCPTCRFLVDEQRITYCTHGYHAWDIPWDDAKFHNDRDGCGDVDTGGCCFWEGRV